jgi:putative colanic acid biosynthesis acetyltransferase WcaF
MKSNLTELTHDDPLKRRSFSVKDRISRLIWNGVQASLFRLSPVPLHGWRCWLLRLFGAKIGASNFVYPTTKIWSPALLETGDVVTLGPGVEVYNPGGISLGHHTIISQNAFLCGATHDFDSFDFDYVKRPIVSGPYAWVCARAIVLPGVELREGSVLGAGAVTSRSLEAWTVYAGNPAKPVRPRKRFFVDGPKVGQPVEEALTR